MIFLGRLPLRPLLNLVNASYSSDLDEPLTMKSITESNPRIVERLSDHFRDEGTSDEEFDRYRPAAYLLEHFDELRDEISEDTVKKIGSLIERVNGLLPVRRATMQDDIIDIGYVGKIAASKSL